MKEITYFNVNFSAKNCCHFSGLQNFGYISQFFLEVLALVVVVVVVVVDQTILKDMFVHFFHRMAQISLDLTNFFSSGAGSCLGLEKNVCQVFDRDRFFLRARNIFKMSFF